MRTIEVVAAVIKQGNQYFCAQRKDQGELAKNGSFQAGKSNLVKPMKKHFQEK